MFSIKHDETIEILIEYIISDILKAKVSVMCGFLKILICSFELVFIVIMITNVKISFVDQFFIF